MTGEVWRTTGGQSIDTQGTRDKKDKKTSITRR